MGRRENDIKAPDGASTGGLAERLRIRAQEHRGLFGSSKDYLLMEEAADALSSEAPSPKSEGEG